MSLCLYSERQQALFLKISRYTVRNLWTAIYQRLGIPGCERKTKRVRAIRKALSMGMIDLDDIVPGDQRFPLELL